MERSMTSHIENVRVAFMQPPWPEFNSLQSFNYDPYSGHSYTPADTQIGPVFSIPRSEKIINANQFSKNNNEMIKKKRLTSEQLALLERSFQEEFKLDSDRKLKLSRELNLHPRQIAVWFQNRRARLKAKQLEQLYESLRQEYDIVSREKHMLHEEVKKLRAILRDQGLIKKQISGVISDGEDTVEISSEVVAHSRTENLNTNQISGLGDRIYGIDHYNNMMVVASSCWPSYS